VVARQDADGAIDADLPQSAPERGGGGLEQDLGELDASRGRHRQAF
jgi:hypothetical protein